MTTTTSSSTQEALEAYKTQIQKLMVLSEGNRETDQEIITQVTELICNQLKEKPSAEELAPFIKGEEAFYRGQYKLALKHHLSAQNVPHFHFFCYRSSAFVSRELGRTSKAIAFARKALAIFPNDYLTLKLLQELLVASDEPEEAEQVTTLLGDIENAVTNGESTTETCEPEEGRPVGLGDEEIHELENLFAEESEEEVTMYDETQSETTSATAESFETPAGTVTTTATESVTDTETTNDATTTRSYEVNLDSDSEETESAIDRLNKLATSDYTIEREATSRFLSESLGVDMASGESLEQRIKSFQRKQVESMSTYVEKSLHPNVHQDNYLCVLNGWSYKDEPTSEAAALTQTLLPANYRKTEGGLFLRWNKKGVAINPGPQFLRNFHEQGFHIKDIDYVIVTRDSADSYADVRAIYDLNYGLNKMASDLHIIHYYLDQAAHRNLANSLKPHFKQERNTVHCLDLYVDSPDTESLSLDDNITLQYFPSGGTERTRDAKGQQQSSIGIRLEMAVPEMLRIGTSGNETVTLGYVTGAAYSPLLASNLGGSDILITGFGSTSADDYGKITYNDKSLGYFGTYSLMEEVAPKLMLFGELNGTEGDIRVEVTRKLRQESAYNGQTSVVLPADTGLTVNLETQQVRCTVSNTFVSPSQIKIVKAHDSFGQLRYLSPSCFI